MRLCRGTIGGRALHARGDGLVAGATATSFTDTLGRYVRQSRSPRERLHHLRRADHIRGGLGVGAGAIFIFGDEGSPT